MRFRRAPHSPISRAEHLPRATPTYSRGARHAARRECREAEARRAVVRCDPTSEEDEERSLLVEQTDTPHKLTLPFPSKLAQLLRRGAVARLESERLTIGAQV